MMYEALARRTIYNKKLGTVIVTTITRKVHGLDSQQGFDEFYNALGLVRSPRPLPQFRVSLTVQSE